MTSEGSKLHSSSTPGIPGGEHQCPGMSRRTFLGLAAATTTVVATEVALETAGVGPISLLRRFFGGRSTKPGGDSVSPSATPEKTAGATAKETATATKEPTVEPEVLPFEIGVENDYGNFSLMIEKGRMKTSTVQIELLNGIKDERTVRGVSNWKVNSREAEAALSKLIEYFAYKRWLKKNGIDPVSVGFETFKTTKENGYKINGVEIPKRKISFILVANPQDKAVRTELTADQMWGIVQTPTRDIVTIWHTFAADDPVKKNISEGVFFWAGALYSQNLLGIQTFVKANGTSFNENIALQYEAGAETLGEFYNKPSELSAFETN